MFKTALLAASALALLSSPALAESIKIGFVTTLTTGGSVIGEDMRRSVELALINMNLKMGDLDVEVIYGDDEFNPQKGRQVTERLVKQQDVDIVAGYIWSNVLLASANVVLDADKILISSNAGPSQLAGKGCNPNFFNVSWQNDQTPMAMGEVLNQKGVENLYVIAPNYAAGKNMVAGVERTFKGNIVGKDMTAWPDQLDWAAELSKVKAANPDGVFIFYPARHGPAFIKQYQQAGLFGQIPLYSVFTLDSISLPRFQEAKMEGVLGTIMTQFWAPDLDNEQNNRFVADYRAKYGTYPAFYGAQAYDTMFLIKSAVEQLGTKIHDVDAFRAAIAKADFPSVRGDFAFGNNQFPIQNFYSREVVADADGNWTTSIRDLVLEKNQDPYAAECAM